MNHLGLGGEGVYFPVPATDAEYYEKLEVVLKYITLELEALSGCEFEILPRGTVIEPSTFAAVEAVFLKNKANGKFFKGTGATVVEASVHAVEYTAQVYTNPLGKP